MMFDFDSQVYEYCKRLGVAYTRYADDLFFSTNKNNVLAQVLLFVETLAFSGDALVNLKVNKKKTQFSSKKRLRRITGLVLTSTNKVSIGREKKRIVKSLVHKFSLGQLDQVGKSNLKGQLAYISSVEPSFIISLKKKYGQDLIENIKS